MRRGLGLLTLGLLFGVVSLLERRRPLRRRVVPERLALTRVRQNVTLGALGAIVSAAVDFLVARRVATWADEHRLGLLRQSGLPEPLRALAALIALDYSLWAWHKLNHDSGTLWRFHLVHHVDRDLDASTGLRFHAGELASTMALRAVQVAVIGVDQRTLAAWQALCTASVLFHHSNVRLPEHVDTALAQVIVTPRLHGIHHSDRGEETNTNYGTILTIWDRLHGTYREGRPQDDIVIGVKGYEDAAEASTRQLIEMPFTSRPRFAR